MDYQDVLAQVGAGIAHPGGPAATLRWTQAIHWKPGLRVLEVGCGTGKTLTELVKRYNCQAIGVDVRPLMVEKARTRSRHAGVEITWLVGDAMALPVDDESVDLVITESVNVFVPDLQAALAEYKRTLRPGGTVVDVEMFVRAPVGSEWREEAKHVYGVRRIPDQPGWKRAYLGTGFHPVHILSSTAVDPFAMLDSDAGEDIDLADPGAFDDPRVVAMLKQNSTWMEQNYHVLGYMTLLASKSGNQPG